MKTIKTFLFLFVLFSFFSCGGGGGDPTDQKPEKGDPGQSGTPGKDGVDGKDGKDGVGIPGQSGTPGKDGVDGKDGKQGLAGCVGNPTACNDNNSCTTDTCDPTINCVYTNNNSPCDDGNACTENDTCSNGLCVGGAAPNCDDGNVSTTDSCDTTGGCVNEPIDCDDGDACTIDEFNIQEAECAYTPVDCNDNNVCTDDTCEDGCQHVNKAAPCDDGDANTVGDQCSGGQCVGGVGPLPDGAICVLFGEADSNVLCLVKMARDAFETAYPAASQFKLTPDLGISISGFSDEICVGVEGSSPCFDLPVGGGNPHSLSTGHFFVTSPDLPWDTSFGVALIANATDPTMPIITAYLDENGLVVGDAVFVTLHVMLHIDVDPATPKYVWASEVLGATASSEPMFGKVVNGVMVMSAAACSEVACNDNNSCTTDTCDPTINCVYTNNISPCDDGNACTANDQCSGGTCVGGAAPSCDDGNPSTTDSCNPAIGCVYTPLTGQFMIDCGFYVVQPHVFHLTSSGEWKAWYPDGTGVNNFTTKYVVPLALSDLSNWISTYSQNGAQVGAVYGFEIGFRDPTKPGWPWFGSAGAPPISACKVWLVGGIELSTTLSYAPWTGVPLLQVKLQ